MAKSKGFCFRVRKKNPTWFLSSTEEGSARLIFSKQGKTALNGTWVILLGPIFLMDLERQYSMMAFCSNLLNSFWRDRVFLVMGYSDWVGRSCYFSSLKSLAI